MNFIVGMFAWMLDSAAYLTEITFYMIRSVWVTIVGAAIVFMEAVDEWLPDIDILDDALLRLLVMGTVGFFLGVVLMIFASFIFGYWGLPCIFALAIGFCMFVGLVADPERDWSLGDWPTFGRSGGPKTPLNL